MPTYQNMVNYVLVAVTFVIPSIAVNSEVPVTLDFLKAVPRLSTPGYTDYYFCCNVVGSFLQWKYNDESLTGFRMDQQVGHSLVNERSEYVYTGTLLSSEPVGNNARAMDSIMIISFRSTVPASFEVTCTNGSHSNTTHAGPVTNVTDSSIMHGNDNGVVLDYITTGAIVRSRSTHIFICGANHSLQLLQATGTPLAFRSSEKLGIHRVASASTYTVNEQGILIARDPFPTVSILIVAHETDVEVACFYGTVRERIRSNKTLVDEMRRTPEPVSGTVTSFDTTSPVSTNTEPTTTTSTIATLPDSTDSEVSSDRTGNEVYAGVVISVVLAVVMVVCLTFLIGFVKLYKCYAAMKPMSKTLPTVTIQGECCNFECTVKQECSLSAEENNAEFRSLEKTKMLNKLKSPLERFMNRFIMGFNPALTDDVVSMDTTSEIRTVQEDGPGFARIITGRSMKTVYVNGETFEIAQKKLEMKHENPSSYWKIIGELFKGFLSKSYSMIKFRPFKVQRNQVVQDARISQVQDGGSQTMAVASGKVAKPFYVRSDGETMTATVNLKDPSEETQSLRRRHSERHSGGTSLTRGLS